MQALIDLDGDDATGKNFRRRDFEKFYREYQAARPLDPERLAALPCANGNPELESTARPRCGANLDPGGRCDCQRKDQT